MNLVKRSIEIIRENQNASGAYIASPNFPTYHYSWLRDGTFIAYALDLMGHYDSAERFYRWVGRAIMPFAGAVDVLIEKRRQGLPIDPKEYPPTRYLLDGRPSLDNWQNFQLDGYGAWIWGLREHCRFTRNHAPVDDLAPAVEISARYISAFWPEPNFDCWEEYGDRVHLSTLACLYAGLQAAEEFSPGRGYRETAERIRQFVLAHGVYDGHFLKHLGWHDVDASLLWLAVPFGLVACDDQLMVNTVKEIERQLLVGGVKRYAKDIYYGGGEWLLLTAWLGWYYTKVGRRDEARRLLAWIEKRADDQGFLPEQVHENLVESYYLSWWQKKWGPVASPLLWSHAMYLILRHELGFHL